jgi:hypothetical protein
MQYYATWRTSGFLRAMCGCSALPRCGYAIAAARTTACRQFFTQLASSKLE